MKKYLCQRTIKKLLLLCFYNFFISYSIDISILLEKCPIEKNNPINIYFRYVDKVFDVEDTESFFYFSDKTQDCLITYKEGNWYLNNKKLKIKNIGLRNEKKENYILYDNNKYEEEIKIHADNDFVYIINTLDLEKYVAAVVAKEVYETWNLKSLELAAIIARTYAIHKIHRHKKKKCIKSFHLKNSIEDQKYCGFIGSEKIKEAVFNTKDKIITWLFEPIIAMYHVCCGGIVPIDCIGFDFKQFPYLKRKKKCTACQNYKRYEWDIELNHNDFCFALSNFLNKKIVKIKKVKKINAKTGTVRRLILEVEIINKKRKKEMIQVFLSNRELRRLLKLQLSDHSPFFNIFFDQEHNLKITGKGNGHLIGVCQIGMNKYIEQGMSIEQIIRFYYPGTEISFIKEIEHVLV